jgi:hypothetical protein
MLNANRKESRPVHAAFLLNSVALYSYEGTRQPASYPPASLRPLGLAERPMFVPRNQLSFGGCLDLP